jgi:SAM-dependent methyltransferase
MSQATADTWLTYWDELPEGQLLFRPEADEYVRNLTSAFPLTRSTRVLDFGCGYGFCAERLAPLVGELYLWDAAPSMRQYAARRLAQQANVRSLDVDTPSSTRLDLILVNSVVQYMTPEELAGWLSRWRDLLAPRGQIVLSDLILPGHGHVRDLLSLVTFSLRRGYLVRAIHNVLAARKRYAEAEKARPLYRPARADLERMARQAGLSLRFLDRNLTHFRSRATAVFSEDVR